MNNRGQIEGSVLWELIGLVLVVLVVAGFLIFIVRFVGSGDDQKEQASIDNFYSLTRIIQKQLANPRPFNPTPNDPLVHPYYIDDEFILVGFVKGGKEQKPVDGCGTPEHITRPDSCGGNACLCLYPESWSDDDFDAEGDDAIKPIACVPFPEVDFILSWWYAPEYGKSAYDLTLPFPSPEYARKTFLGQCYPWTDPEYERLTPKEYLKGWRQCGNIAIPPKSVASLVVYGQCGETGTQHSQQTLYVEKAVWKGKTYVLVGAASSDPKIKKELQDIIDTRRRAVEGNYFFEKFDLAEQAFKNGKYAESISLYQQFIDATVGEKSIEEGRAASVRRAHFQISEAYLKVGNLTRAAEKALEFMQKFGITSYFQQTGEVMVATLPLPVVRAGGYNFGQLQYASPAQLSAALQRFESLHAGKPESAVLTYLLGTLHHQAGTDKYVRAINLLINATDGLDTRSLVHPLIASYEVAQAFRKGLDLVKNPHPDEVTGMLSWYSRVVDEYDGSIALLALYNDAHTWLALKCAQYKDLVTDPSLCEGLPGLTPGTDIGLVYQNWNCSSPSTMRRCGDYTANEFDVFLREFPNIKSGLNSRHVFACAGGSLPDGGVWKDVRTCPEGFYCRNTADRSLLDAECFKPTSTAPEGVLP